METANWPVVDVDSALRIIWANTLFRDAFGLGSEVKPLTPLTEAVPSRTLEREPRPVFAW